MKQAAKLLTIFLSAVALFASVQTVSAQQYGDYDGDNKRLSVDKKVFNPDASVYQYVDNISATQYTFAPGQQVWFAISVSNTGDKEINEIEVRDTLPTDYLYLIDGQVSRFIINDLDRGENQIRYIVANIKDEDDINWDGQNMVCPTNRVNVEIKDDEDDPDYEDTAQFCIDRTKVAPSEEPVIPGKTLGFQYLPATGPGLGVLALAGSALMALTGGALIKKKH